MKRMRNIQLKHTQRAERERERANIFRFIFIQYIYLNNHFNMCRAVRLQPRYAGVRQEGTQNVKGKWF